MVLDKSRFPEIMNLGSLLGFALLLEEAAGELYTEMARQEPGETGDRLVSAHRKRRRLLEEARREKLNEVTLEPIAGFSGNDYLIAIERIDRATVSTFEMKCAAFYRNAAKAARTISPEISRILERFARDNDSYGKDAG